MTTPRGDELELSAADQDRLLALLERRLPHLLDEPARVDWYTVEVLSYWAGRSSSGRKARRDWPMTILNRMLVQEPRRFGGAVPDPATVRAEQAERRLAAAAVRVAEASAKTLPTTPRPTGATPRRPREVE